MGQAVVPMRVYLNSLKLYFKSDTKSIFVVNTKTADVIVFDKLGKIIHVIRTKTDSSVESDEFIETINNNNDDDSTDSSQDENLNYAYPLLESPNESDVDTTGRLTRFFYRVNYWFLP